MPLSFILSPVGRWVVAAIVALALIASIYGKGHHDGRTGAEAKIEAANTKAANKADAAERDVLACPPGKWSKEVGKCER